MRFGGHPFERGNRAEESRGDGTVNPGRDVSFNMQDTSPTAPRGVESRGGEVHLPGHRSALPTHFQRHDGTDEDCATSGGMRLKKFVAPSTNEGSSESETETTLR